MIKVSSFENLKLRILKERKNRSGFEGENRLSNVVRKVKCDVVSCTRWMRNEREWRVYRTRTHSVYIHLEEKMASTLRIISHITLRVLNNTGGQKWGSRNKCVKGHQDGGKVNIRLRYRMSGSLAKGFYQGDVHREG